MSHRSDEVPDIGSDLDLINITVGRRLSCPGSSFSLQQLTKNSKRVYTDGVDYAKQVTLRVNVLYHIYIYPFLK
ncbi:unnamed protein product [Schistosoma mattheei]|uniref:Uncharacterized protein n=1 Tax=Schistosoma mattheei TaxID=31246 RepID=A0A183PYL8_9TREM|nr:unnamed protein product [Schistosoma mattheei]